MDKLNEILRSSKQQASTAAHTVSETASTQASKVGKVVGINFTRKDFVKFINANKLPRYLMYSIIFVKTMSIYDKIRQIVAVNEVHK